jgi:hypothetical protein
MLFFFSANVLFECFPIAGDVKYSRNQKYLARQSVHRYPKDVPPGYLYHFPRNGHDDKGDKQDHRYNGAFVDFSFKQHLYIPVFL